MLGSQHCSLFLLVSGGLRLVTGNISKSGCSGESVKLYTDISFNSDNIAVTLYKNGKNYTLVGMWSKEGSDDVKESLENNYQHKVEIDKHGNLWIHKLNITDEAKYIIIFAIKTWSITVEVQLVVLVPPSSDCIPYIKRMNNTLIASLGTEDCGSPAASVYWLNHSGLVYENNAVKLKPGKEAGTYYACTKSSALYCARKSEYTYLCKDFIVHEKDTLPTLPRLPELKTSASEIHLASTELTMIILTILLPSIFMFAVVMLIIIILHHKKKTQNLRTEVKNVPHRSTEETHVPRDEETGHTNAGSGLGSHNFSVDEAGNTSTWSSEETQSLRTEVKNVPHRSTEETHVPRDEETGHTNAGSGLGSHNFSIDEAGNTSTGSSEEIQSLRAEDENVPQRSTEGSKVEETGNKIISSPEDEESPLLREEDAPSSAPGKLSSEHLSSSLNKGLIRLSTILRPKSPI